MSTHHQNTPAHARRSDSSNAGLSHHWPRNLPRSLADRPDGAQSGVDWPVYSPEQPIQAHCYRAGCACTWQGDQR
jgi:hypothetical protein